MPQEAWYEKGNERAGLTRTQVPQQRHQREQEPTERGGMVQTGKCGQTQRCAVMSGLWKQHKHPQQSWCCQLFAPRQAAEADRITPLQQHQGSETAVLGRELASVPTSRAQEDVFLSFLWEECSSKRWLGHEAREEAELPRWHCLFCHPPVLI